MSKFREGGCVWAKTRYRVRGEPERVPDYRGIAGGTFDQPAFW